MEIAFIINGLIFVGIPVLLVLIFAAFTKRIQWLKIATLSIAIVSFLTTGYHIFFTADMSGGGPASSMLHQYRKYYIAKRDTSGISWGTGYNYRTIVYFFPGQKSALIKRLKKDVEDEVKKVVEAAPNYFYKYEISEDFRKVYFYKHKGAVWQNNKIDALAKGSSEYISDRISLYIVLKNYNHPSGGVYDIIEDETEKEEIDAALYSYEKNRRK
ncbi:MAG: hypothetical protein FWG69_01445 [Oscillospiraceae bacterium]|nr:hypothetical protein [Oscillospiraceae bacterium]